MTEVAGARKLAGMNKLMLSFVLFALAACGGGDGQPNDPLEEAIRFCEVRGGIERSSSSSQCLNADCTQRRTVVTGTCRNTEAFRFEG